MFTVVTGDIILYYCFSADVSDMHASSIFREFEESNNLLSHDKVFSFYPEGGGKSLPKFRRYLHFDVLSVFIAAHNFLPIAGQEIPPKFR